MFLIRKAAADRGYTVANSFNSGTLKNRISMMLKKRSKRMSALRVLFVIPIMGLSLAATVRTVTDYDPANGEEEFELYQQVEVSPTFGGGDANAFSKWVNENLNCPDDESMEKAQRSEVMQFTVTVAGEVKGVRLLRGSGIKSLDDEALRVVSASPKWTPGFNKDGVAVPVVYTLTVKL